MFEWQGFIAANLGWAIIVYVMWRNQRAAKGSPLVDDTNFGPRVGSIVEVALHPDHAATWLVECPEAEAAASYWEPEEEKTVWFKLVFPAIGQDSSEQYGIRGDDGESS